LSQSLTHFIPQQCLDLLSEKIDKLGLVFFEGVFLAALSHPRVLTGFSGERAPTWMD